jgi:hypothetical protein
MAFVFKTTLNSYIGMTVSKTTITNYWQLLAAFGVFILRTGR